MRISDWSSDVCSSDLYNVIIKILGEREETEDVLQECFIKIWKNIDYYDINKGRLFTWMLQITKNTTIDFARSASIQKEKKTNRLENDSPIIENKRVTFLYTDHLGLNTVIDRNRTRLNYSHYCASRMTS